MLWFLQFDEAFREVFTEIYGQIFEMALSEGSVVASPVFSLLGDQINLDDYLDQLNRTLTRIFLEHGFYIIDVFGRLMSYSP